MPLGRSLESTQGYAFRRCKIASHNIHGPRQVAHLLDIDTDRVIESHREHAAIAAAGDAELEIGTVCPRDQIRLAMMIPRKGQRRRVCIAIDGKYPPRHPMRLDETHPITLE